MRATLSLILVVILTAFAAGYLALSYRNAPAPEPSLEQIATARQDFMRGHRARGKIRLSDLYSPKERAELIDPAMHLPQSAKYGYTEISALYRYSGSCDRAELIHASKRAPLNKAWLWHRFRCHALRELPDTYFATPPLVHPSGSSFAFMAYRSGVESYSSAEWVRTNRSRFHVAELGQIPAGALDSSQIELSKLDRAGQAALAGNATLVLSADSILIRSNPSARSEDAQDPVYEVYDLGEFQRFLRTYPVSLQRANPLKGCFLLEGNACWSFNAERIYRSARLPSLLLLGATLLLTAALGWLLLKRVREQRLEEERKRFALQALTHELRTPITSLRLSAETLRGHFDEFTPEVQDTFLRVCDDLQRLQRLTDASRQYLGALEPGKLISLKPARIESFFDFLQAMAEPYGDKVQVEPPRTDGAITQDGYWLAICVKNLLENAIAHGKPTVRLAGTLHGGNVEISVGDQGSCRFASLDEMVAPFAKSGESTGLGLGLSLVKRITREMGGRIEFRPNPTTFALHLPNPPKGSP